MFFHLATPSDFEVLLVQGLEFILRHIIRVYMHHINNKETMDNVLRTSVVHEDCLLTVNCLIFILLHPC